MHGNHDALELEVELDAHELRAPLRTAEDVLEIDDLVVGASASMETPPAQAPVEYALDETSEIELTAEQMDALLEGRWPC